MEPRAVANIGKTASKNENRCAARKKTQKTVWKTEKAVRLLEQPAPHNPRLAFLYVAATGAGLYKILPS